jgi:hypothetical protein
MLENNRASVLADNGMAGIGATNTDRDRRSHFLGQEMGNFALTL